MKSKTTLFALYPDALQGALAMPVSNNKLPLWDWKTLPLPAYYCLHIIWKQTSYKPSLESKFKIEAYQSYLAKDCHELFRIWKNQIVARNIRIVAHRWTLCKSHLLRLFFNIQRFDIFWFLLQPNHILESVLPQIEKPATDGLSHNTRDHWEIDRTSLKFIRKVWPPEFFCCFSCFSSW